MTHPNHTTATTNISGNNIDDANNNDDAMVVNHNNIDETEHNDHDDDDDEEIFTLFKAYLAAQDDDVMNAQNAMSRERNRIRASNSTTGSAVVPSTTATTAATATAILPTVIIVPSLSYHVIPYHWFQSFYHHVICYPTKRQRQQQQQKSNCVPNDATTTMKRNSWKDSIGPIQQLLPPESQTTAPPPPPPVFLNELQQRVQQQQQQQHYGESAVDDPTTDDHYHHCQTNDANTTVAVTTPPPPPPPQYGRDYLLVGSSVWLLLSSKFGCCNHHNGTITTTTLIPACSCVSIHSDDMRISNHHQQQQQHTGGDGRFSTTNNNKNKFESSSSQLPSPSSRIAVAVARPCGTNERVATTAATTTTTIYDYIPIPSTGRFPYELYFSKQSPFQLDNDSKSTHIVNNTNTTSSPQAPVTNSTDRNKIHNETTTTASSSSSNVIRLPPSTTTTIVPSNPQQSDGVENDITGRLNHFDYSNNNHVSNSAHNNNNHVNDDDDDDDDDRSLLGTTNTSTTSRYNNEMVQQPGQQNAHYWMPNGNTSIVNTEPVRRKYGSGLGNLGNTCFMNSTLQCLGHTMVLQYYFLSQQYQTDLNRLNPLGTGGELATQFAQLLSEMWSTTTTTTTMTTATNQNNNQQSSNDNCEDDKVRYTTASNVVYPKNFKYTLGKHAAQFMGYDQHDSQELATYLLDALHEDCNRVTSKPYIEKPEQTTDETDQQASDKAWELHLQREDSHILEYFMGQVKSRVQCNQIECQRVSTTFDPFMFLSVPIPGSEDRTMLLTFFPIEAHLPNVQLSIKISKMSTIDDMLQKVVEILPDVYDTALYESSSLRTSTLSTSDLVVCDIWKKEVFDFYKNTDDIDRIRDSDETFVYQLSSLQIIRQQEAQINDETFTSTTSSVDGDNDVDIFTKYNFKEWKRNNINPNAASVLNGGSGSSISSSSNDTIRTKYRIWKLDVGTSSRLNRSREWLRVLEENFMRKPLELINAYNPTRGGIGFKVRIYEALSSFLDQLHQSIAIDDVDDDDRYEYGVQKRVRGSTDFSNDSATVRELMSCSRDNKTFRNVQTMEDLAILEFIAKKMLSEMRNGDRTNQTKQSQSFPNGIIVSASMHTSTQYSGVPAAMPLVLRLSSNTSVYQFREIVAQRLERCVRRNGTTTITSRSHAADNATIDPTTNTTSDNYWSTTPDNSQFTVAQAWDDVPGEKIVSENGHGPAAMDLDATDRATSSDLKSFEMAIGILRRIPLFYDRKNAVHARSYANSKPMGSVNSEQPPQQQQQSQYQYTAPSNNYYRQQQAVSVAQRNHNEEKDLISELVGNYGTIYVEFPSSVVDDESFDFDTLHAVDIYQPSPSSSSARNNSGDITVLDCIEKFCQKEQLEESEQWYCSRCQKHVCAWKQFHIYRCPPHLIVHLKRFQFSARTHRRQKINIHVDFPLVGLDLSKQVLHWNNDNEKPIYDCYAVSNHYGGLGGGHYTAYAVNDDGVWCHYDDSRITTHVSPSEVVSSAAYVLYYRRRDIPVDMAYVQKIVSSSQSISTQQHHHHPMQQQQPYKSPYLVIGRDDIDDNDGDENGPLLSNRSEPRGIATNSSQIVPLFDETDNDDDDDTNNNDGMFEEVPPTTTTIYHVNNNRNMADDEENDDGNIHSNNKTSFFKSDDHDDDDDDGDEYFNTNIPIIVDHDTNDDGKTTTASVPVDDPIDIVDGNNDNNNNNNEHHPTGSPVATTATSSGGTTSTSTTTKMSSSLPLQ